MLCESGKKKAVAQARSKESSYGYSMFSFALRHPSDRVFGAATACLSIDSRVQNWYRLNHKTAPHSHLHANGPQNEGCDYFGLHVAFCAPLLQGPSPGLGVPQGSVSAGVARSGHIPGAVFEKNRKEPRATLYIYVYVYRYIYIYIHICM